MPKHDMIFYANRSTAQVVPKGQRGKSKAGYGKQIKRRAATPSEEKTIAKGRWVRTRASGKSASNPTAKKTKYRPWLVKKKKVTTKTVRKSTRKRAK